MVVGRRKDETFTRQRYRADLLIDWSVGAAVSHLANHYRMRCNMRRQGLDKVFLQVVIIVVIIILLTILIR